MTNTFLPKDNPSVSTTLIDNFLTGTEKSFLGMHRVSSKFPIADDSLLRDYVASTSSQETIFKLRMVGKKGAIFSCNFRYKDGKNYAGVVVLPWTDEMLQQESIIHIYYTSRVLPRAKFYQC